MYWAFNVLDNRFEVAEYLVYKVGINIDTDLYWALERQYDDLAAKLLSLGANLDTKDVDTDVHSDYFDRVDDIIKNSNIKKEKEAQQVANDVVLEIEKMIDNETRDEEKEKANAKHNKGSK